MEVLDFNAVPAKALKCSTRLKLGEFLDPKQEILFKNGFARDYRGLADQMDFQYNEVRNFERYDSPTLKIIDAWSVLPHTTMGQLIQYLENMGRHDILQDLQPKLELDAKSYIQRYIQAQSQESPLQVDEISSCRSVSSDVRLDDSGILTREDAYTGEVTVYDAFVCYADEDIEFVRELARFLEAVGFKLYIRERDMLAGQSEYETSLQLIHERCKRVLIILSPDFLRCPAYEAQASFAAGLGIDEKCRKLIPIVHKPCDIPMMLKFISKIDFTKPGCVVEWIWDKVISSLRDGHGPSSSFVSTERRYPAVLPQSFQQIQPGSPDPAYPSITYPPSTSSIINTSCSISPPQMIFQEESLSDSAVNLNRVASKQKSKLENFRFWKLPKKNTNDCSTSSSNVTSGFHSQMSDEGSEPSRWAQPFSATWDRMNQGT
ncbi:myeloid differentiation primary response protein MyD88 [Parasteatoda tepidariorum]|uniref:myeloid differentiation primary response protein MyD88 n=1 Tax=Parasteatoda tepidariorum TaxID=114398 RepID=UPI00077FB644|nr:myeloid differentiation primary response protein MyD88 [Parasteatoda tepidariorum]